MYTYSGLPTPCGVHPITFEGAPSDARKERGFRVGTLFAIFSGMNANGNSTGNAVCAWCHHEYSNDQTLGLLNDADYAKVISHGICPSCKVAVLAEAKQGVSK